MADTKISALTALTNPADTDVLPIVDGTGPTTKKVAVSNLTAGRNVSASQFTSTVAIGTAPLVVTSTTNVANLNASSLNGATFAAPGTVGTAGSALTIAGNLNASTAGQIVTLSPSTTGYVTINPNTAGSINNMSVGASTASTGRFTSITTTTGGADITTAGQGVNFSGNTGAAGKTSSTLTWYEEGTWTPAIAPGTGSVTLTSPTNSMYYTRIGRMVTVSGQVVVSAIATPTGDLKITGIPFSTTSKLSAGAVQVTAFLNTGAASRAYNVVNRSGVTDGIYIHGIQDGQEKTAVAANLAAGSSFVFSFTYLI